MMMALVLMTPRLSAGCLATCKFPNVLVLHAILSFTSVTQHTERILRAEIDH